MKRICGCLVMGVVSMQSASAQNVVNHAQIGKLRNGDAAYIAAEPRGRWLYVENGALNGREAKFRGWIYDAWCMYYP